MGTSALEGAILGIPTIISDASHSDFPENYRYRFIQDDLPNYAGTFVDKKSKFSGFLITEIIKMLENRTTAIKLSEETKVITQQIFSTERICDVIDNLNPEGHISDVLKFMPSKWVKKFRCNTNYIRH